MKFYVQNRWIFISYSFILLIFFFCFWLGKAAWLSYQEQYQLFLYTNDYLAERIATMGGLTDYIAEFVVQFYYVPWLGALLTALILTAIQVISGIICIRNANQNLKPTIYILSALPSILLLYAMADENLLLSFAVAILIAEIATWFFLTIVGKNGWCMVLGLICGFLILYWCIGPVSVLYILLSAILKRDSPKIWIFAPLILILGVIVIFFLHRTLYTQYPSDRLFFGLNYYRIPEVYPLTLLWAPLSLILLTLISRIKVEGNNIKTVAVWCSFGTLTAIIVVFTIATNNYDALKGEIFEYDYLVRNGKWHEIIKKAETMPPTSDFCLQGLNLALAKTGQLGDRMFEFEQHGIGSLLGKYERDNTSCLITAEAFYHLGMINSAFRYNFDLQEAIMNDRKSGRFMKRMAECLIINGKYKAASKYINKLKQSLYYRQWANNAEKYLYDEERINKNPDWREKRQIRYKQEMLYYYPEIHKMLGILVGESNGQNILAWDYFNAALMLKGDLAMMAGMSEYGKNLFNISTLPRHHQEALAMYWTMNNPSFEGMPFNISDETKQRLMALAQIYSANPNNPGIWSDQFPNSFWTYFLKHQKTDAPNTPHSTEREG